MDNSRFVNGSFVSGHVHNSDIYRGKISVGVATERPIIIGDCLFPSNHDAYIEKYCRGEFNLHGEKVGPLIEMADKGTHFEIAKKGDTK